MAYGHVEDDTFVVEKCPYCKEKHTHGSTPSKSDSASFRSHGFRNSHCCDVRVAGEYELVEKKG